MLRRCPGSRVRHFINELPDTLDETYQRVLKGVHKTNQGHVQRLLQCLAVAFRPLRVDELAAILTFDPDANEIEVGDVPTLDAASMEDQEQELLSMCPSLITIVDNRGSRVVQFSHFSVKEFLASDRLATSTEDISRYHILPDDAHTTLARACLGLLLRLGDRVDKKNAKSIPLAQYAAEHWVFHAQAELVSSRLMGAMKTLFDSDKPHFAAWVRIRDIDRRLWFNRRRKAGDPLYHSALCGFYDLVEHLIKIHPQHINTIGGQRDCPLAAALYGGHIRVAEFLFQHGANVNFQGLDQETPLHIAVTWPIGVAEDAVEFLLKHGADVDARREDLSTPLHLAPNDFARDHQRGQGRRASIVRRLLEYGADVNSRDIEGATPLHVALERWWNLDVAWVLVNHGADVNVANIRGQTPLHLVRDPKLGRLLLEHGADVNAQDENQLTPLHSASSILLPELVQVLLDHQANVHAEDEWGRTPLHRVFDEEDYSDKGCMAVARLLTAHGADVNALDKDHETVLHQASRHVSLEVAWILLEHGADLNLENKEGKIPFQLVWERTREETEVRPSNYVSWEAWRARRVECVALMGLLYSY
jgi:ankyrin repeat protein